VKIHIDIGPICWQFISVVQPNVEHEDGIGKVVELSSDTEVFRSGFQPNEEE
jgi:hypothetical protein